MVKKCDCKHEVQDERYGKGNRLHNWRPDKPKTGEYRCTVCGKTRD